MSGLRVIPKNYSFRKLRTNLKIFGIGWHVRKGKGGHGSFVGLDKYGSKQSYSLPKSQHREVRHTYLKGLCRRFGFADNETLSQVFQD